MIEIVFGKSTGTRLSRQESGYFERGILLHDFILTVLFDFPCHIDLLKEV